ncbi:phosphoenolpyruvate carboxykinase, putative [Theileria equi strain WA]|uniref:Phosphoenolpyruvate carboxykinase, putative n=1 Tax=Theileria equi strain WA TaxID=1537102 RepID=L0AXR5_THEEQ|nr:phosphoenolpyruvate carboxykinase, putative [Theileria equi strain WA]AFZ80043.1 phosphoenolpyruvate carboxykinase, putative [Theileria equi strain WA]|eukprot:XP_004829709.1 phosphoenolpyruvate carboxykinase, putative [Theileria equi strain WA]
MAKITQSRVLAPCNTLIDPEAKVDHGLIGASKTFMTPLDTSKATSANLPLSIDVLTESDRMETSKTETSRILQEELDREKRLFLRQNSRDFGELDTEKIWYNPCVASLYHHALRFEPHTVLTSTGALACLSGEKTGRSPLDKRTVLDADSRDKVWWESVNIPIEDKSFEINKRIALDYINQQDRVYVIDAFAGWSEEHRVKVRIVSTRAYHALFMHNLLIVPEAKDLVNFVPDFTIYNAGPCEANKTTPG